MQKSLDEISKALKAPFPAVDVDWRIQSLDSSKARGLAVAYLKSRAIQTRFDEVVGFENWRNEFKPWHNIDGRASQLCGISIYINERDEWITKWDGGENTDIEPIKGGLSDSFKRAAVTWGVGRYLYSIDGIWVDVEQRGKGYFVKKSANEALIRAYTNSIDGKASNVTPFPYDYTVCKVEQRQFSSGDGMVLRLKNAEGKNIEAFLQHIDQNLAEGVCLKNVTLVPFKSNGYSAHTLSGYEVA